MRTRVFIDGEWMHKTAGTLGIDIDYKALHALYAPEVGETVAFDYFQIEAIKEDGTSTIRRLLDWLDCNGYRVKTIPADLETKNSIRDTRSELMVWMGVEIAKAAERRVDHIVIWSGDRAMSRAIEAAKSAGATVTVVLKKRGCPGVLLRAADTVVDFAGYCDEIKQKASA